MSVQFWRRLRLAAVTALSALALMTAACTSDSAGGKDTADQIHLSWTGDPHTTMTVTWHTTYPGQTALLLSDAGKETNVEPVATDATNARPIGPGYWHEANLTGLIPGHTYSYVITGNGGRSDSYTFTTEPVKPSYIRFDVFADQGACHFHRPACRVIAGIASDRPDFVFGAGDLTYANDDGHEAADMWANDVMAYSTGAPLMVTMGNHEWAVPGDSANNYRGRFAMPSQHDEDFYSFDYGSVHVVALPETYVDMRAGKPFSAWLDGDLAAAHANPQNRWIVLFDHRPFFSTGKRHGPTQQYVHDVLPLVNKYHVDLVISGHEHNYERTYPMDIHARPTTNNAQTWARGIGTAFIVTGGGGANTYDDFGPAQRWDAVRKATHEHLRIDVTDWALHVVAIGDDNAGRVLDEFVITAVAAPAAVPAPPRR